MELSFFRADGDDLLPNPLACSLWSKDQMHGVAVSGALSRALEQAVLAEGRDDLQPARHTVDLFRPARMSACRTSTTVVRQGPRIALIDAVLTQDDVPVARASTVFLKPAEDAPGAVWTPEHQPELPPLDLAPVSDDPRIPIFGSEGGGWSQNFGEHQNAGRKSTWQTGVPTVSGEQGTPFQAVASIADATSMVTNWGSAGVEYINTDITLTLVRRPVSLEIGLRAVDRVARDGIAIGTAQVFDRAGVLGTAVVSALANAKRTVDFEEHNFGGTA